MHASPGQNFVPEFIPEQDQRGSARELSIFNCTHIALSSFPAHLPGAWGKRRREKGALTSGFVPHPSILVRGCMKELAECSTIC